MRSLNALLFPAGTEIGLEIYHALKSTKNVRLHAAGQDVSNHARFVFDEYHVVPSVHEPGWESALRDVCLRNKIDYIFPCHDDTIPALAGLSDSFPARAVLPAAETCRITRSKRDTYKALRGTVKIPVVYPAMDQIRAFPVFVKPDKGQGSQGVSLVTTASALHTALHLAKDPVICEYLPGNEFTVDCVSSSDGRVIYAQARQRGRMRNGIAVNTRSYDWSDAMSWAMAIAEKLPMKGAWFFQVKEDVQAMPTLLEVAPRIAGSMAIHRVRGVNFPLLSLYAHEGIRFEVQDNMVPLEMDRALGNRYAHDIRFAAVYVDLDDTLIVRNRVNVEVVSFLYQCINDGKPIHLITRHAGDLQAVLERWRLRHIFSGIIHVLDGSPKSSHITHPRAILIDDSHAEREDARRQGIMAFDPSMIECLSSSIPYKPD